MFSKLKQFKDLRDKAKKIQSALATESVEGTAAWGKVKVVVDGNQAVTAVVIDAELLRPEKKSDLESAIKDAANDAVKKAQRKMVEKMKEMGGVEGLGL